VTGLVVLTGGQLGGQAVARADEPLMSLRAGALEAEVEALFTPTDRGSRFDDLDPFMLFGVRGALYVGSGLSLGAGVRSSLSDPEATHLEATASIAWTSVSDEPLAIPPALRVGARVEVGWRWLELRGSDFVVDDDGFTTVVAGELGFVPMRAFALVARVGAALVAGSSEALEQPVVQARIGLAVIANF